MSWAFNIPFKVEKAPSWTNPYVTDGLVAMWDGEWNAGGGVHDASAEKWYDLSGNGHDLTVVDGVFEPNCGVVYSSSEKVKDGWRTDIPILTQMDSRSPCMIDFVGHFKCDSAWSVNVMPFYTRNLSIAVYQRNIAVFHSRFYRTDANFFTVGAFCIDKDRVILDQTMQFAYPFMVDAPSSNISTSEQLAGNLYIDGSRKDVLRNTGASITGTDVISRMLDVDGNFVKLNRVCIYDRILTSQEIAANYAVDKERFDLP